MSGSKSLFMSGGSQKALNLIKKIALHIMSWHAMTTPKIGTGRILSSGEISRIAVLKFHRKEQVDKIILQALFKIAREMNLKEIFIYSPLDAIEYFRKFNFNSTGVVFMEAGRPRQKMTCLLNEAHQAKYYLSH
jgi:predicted GNAT family N-acyltransferase